MIRRQTGIALLVFVALVIVAVLLGRRPEADASDQTPTPTPEPFWSLESSDIVGLTVENLRTGELIELERDEQDLWRIIRPESMPADPARVERAVSWLAQPRPRTEIAEAADLAPFELDDPHYRVSARTASGESYQMTIGREAPTGGSRYASSDRRPGVWVFSTVGLDEVLQLQPDLLPSPSPEPTATASLTPEPTAQATPSQTATPEPTQEPEG